MAQLKEREKTAKAARKFSQEEMEREAYFHWLNRGCPNGDSLADWLEVEKECASPSGKRAGERSKPAR